MKKSQRPRITIRESFLRYKWAAALHRGYAAVENLQEQEQYITACHSVMVRACIICRPIYFGAQIPREYLCGDRWMVFADFDDRGLYTKSLAESTRANVRMRRVVIDAACEQAIRKLPKEEHTDVGYERDMLAGEWQHGEVPVSYAIDGLTQQDAEALAVKLAELAHHIYGDLGEFLASRAPTSISSNTTIAQRDQDEEARDENCH